MSIVGHSEGFLTDRVRTRMFFPDDDGVQVLLADVHKWELYAFHNDELEPFYAELEKDPALIMFDVLRPWSVDAVGYNVEHLLYYGHNGYVPRQAGMVRLEFTFYCYTASPTVFIPRKMVHVRKLAPTRQSVLAR